MKSCDRIFALQMPMAYKHETRLNKRALIHSSHQELIIGYSQTSNISGSLEGLSALLQLHIHSRLNTWLQLIGQRQLQDETKIIHVLEFGATYIRGLAVYPLTRFVAQSWREFQ